jgi:hypothetical protein
LINSLPPRLQQHAPRCHAPAVPRGLILKYISHPVSPSFHTLHPSSPATFFLPPLIHLLLLAIPCQPRATTFKGSSLTSPPNSNRRRHRTFQKPPLLLIPRPIPPASPLSPWILPHSTPHMTTTCPRPVARFPLVPARAMRVSSLHQRSCHPRTLIFIRHPL